MINGIFDICPECGHEVSAVRDIADGHKSQESDAAEYPYHLVWSCHSCGLVGETKVTSQTLKSIRDFSAVKAGNLEDDQRELSEAEVTLIEGGVALGALKTLADTGWEIASE